MTKQTRLSNLSVLLLAMVIVLCVSWLWQNSDSQEEMEYSEMRQLFLQEKVERFSIDSDGTLTMELRDRPDGSKPVRYQLYDFQLFYDDLNSLVQQQAAEGIILDYDYPEPESTDWLSLLLPYVLVAGVFGLIWYVMVLRSQGSGMGPDKMSKFGSARTRMLTDKDKKVTFEDGESLAISGVFVAVGVAGSTDLAKKLGAATEGNRILVDEKMATNVPGLYAAGDCTGGMLQIAKAVYQGAQAGTSIVAEIRKKK